MPPTLGHSKDNQIEHQFNDNRGDRDFRGFQSRPLGKALYKATSAFAAGLGIETCSSIQVLRAKSYECELWLSIHNYPCQMQAAVVCSVSVQYLSHIPAVTAVARP